MPRKWTDKELRSFLESEHAPDALRALLTSHDNLREALGEMLDGFAGFAVMSREIQITERAHQVLRQSRTVDWGREIG